MKDLSRNSARNDMNMKALTGKFSGWLTRMLASSRTPFSFFMALWALTSTYRIMLTVGLFTNPIRPFDFSPGSHPIRFTLAYWYYDLVLLLVGFLLSWILSRGKYFLKEGKIDGDDLTFSINIDYQGNPVRLVVKGKVAGDEIKFDLGTDDGAWSTQLTAKKS